MDGTMWMAQYGWHFMYDTIEIPMMPLDCAMPAKEVNLVGTLWKTIWRIKSDKMWFW